MIPAADLDCSQQVEYLNRDCHCLSLNREAVLIELKSRLDSQLYRMLVEERPFLFAESAVFVSEVSINKQHQIISAIERVISLPAYQQMVMQYAPESAQFLPKASGVFLGYDFHIGPNGPQLIEINSNAGGALINALLAQAQQACCNFISGKRPGDALLNKQLHELTKSMEDIFMEMFWEEWRLEKDSQPLQTIAIVDEEPDSQFMLPEFILFKQLFEKYGIKAIICDPAELAYSEGRLCYYGLQIDLIYNRLTDFGLEQEASKHLLEAYLDSAVVLTPHPRNHALYADKRNLALLTNPEILHQLNLDAKTQTTLTQGIAYTECVREQDADSLWDNRKHLFFKPAKGFGSKAAYRGDKVTKRVFGELLRSDYVAQQLVQPSERQLEVDHEIMEFKVDLRNYVYNAQVQSICARLYQGQTTNFRTPGGGFAQVIAVPCDHSVLNC